ncbi:hypothetical protein MAPG_06674 [Magnaporthiopsis poae ATCC 64411]|uniref:Uncharacterized protein n=1 Tax=Magnaporthiopsis poae (strain ATCC 64411 / 73-15) TaxID=644358 RepID=A0A0C4E2N4_MAGP6|nr:hypothetical protein MAPG_06674 [Magnaporthiopsis poae ATCC 64411]
MDGKSGRGVAAEKDRHAAHMSRSIHELERMVKQHEDSLHRTIQDAGRAQRHSSGPAQPSAAASVEIMAAGYKEAAESAPPLPGPDSLLPALVAMRKTHRTIEESRAFLAAQSVSADKARKRLEAAEADLQDQRALQKCLEDRIRSLRSGLESRIERSPEEMAQERLEELQRKKRSYDQEAASLLKAFNQFIDEHLAPLLAAEELGGPVVGDMMDVDSDGLVAGFSSQGKVKKAKDHVDQDLRQRRIDEIWGSPSARPVTKPREGWDETAAAASDMRELTEELLRSLVESEGDGWAAYVKITRESAAARFLVRSRVAQFHPKDATRLRLVDFGKELDD